MSHDRLLAMILLLRHTGLRIGDVVRFSTDRLKDKSAFLHMAKTGNPLWLPLPEFLVAKLKMLPLYEDKFFFAGGSASLGTATGNARRSLRAQRALRSTSSHPVTAPVDADETSFAYFAMTPVR